MPKNPSCTIQIKVFMSLPTEMASVMLWFTFAFSEGKRKLFCARELSAAALSAADLESDFSVLDVW